MSIRLEGLVKRYEKNAVIKDLSLDVEKGELFVLLGTSGSGKSTLLRMIAGLTSIDAGEIYLNGRSVTHLPIQERGVGFVFQNYSLFRHLNVVDNIAFGLDVKRISRKERDRRVGELLSLIGLSDFGNRKPTQLSGGQQQRVALARALAPNPQVLLMDEPFGDLDVNIRTQLRRNLREIQQRLGITAILVTHDQQESFELADRIGIIERAGRKKRSGLAQGGRRPGGDRGVVGGHGDALLAEGLPQISSNEKKLICWFALYASLVTNVRH